MEKMLKSPYEDFDQLWFDVSVIIYDEDKDLKRFLFDFQLNLIVSLWSTLSDTDKDRVKSIAGLYLGYTLVETLDLIIKIRENLSGFSLPKNSIANEVSASITLLTELVDCEDIYEDYAFNEAISMEPEFLNYPVEAAFNIFRVMGYERDEIKTYKF